MFQKPWFFVLVMFLGGRAVAASWVSLGGGRAAGRCRVTARGWRRSQKRQVFENGGPLRDSGARRTGCTLQSLPGGTLPGHPGPNAPCVRQLEQSRRPPTPPHPPPPHHATGMAACLPVALFLHLLRCARCGRAKGPIARQLSALDTTLLDPLIDADEARGGRTGGAVGGGEYGGWG